jgi:hypothetical protein
MSKLLGKQMEACERDNRPNAQSTANDPHVATGAAYLQHYMPLTCVAYRFMRVSYWRPVSCYNPHSCMHAHMQT